MQSKGESRQADYGGLVHSTLTTRVTGALAINGSSAGLRLILAIALARFLGPTLYGGYAYIVSIATLASTLPALGFPTLLLRDVARLHARSAFGQVRVLVRRATIISFIASLALAAALYLILRRSAQLESVPSAHLVLTLGMTLIPLMALEGVLSGGVLGLGSVVPGMFPRRVLVPVGLLLYAVFSQVSRRAPSVAEIVGVQALLLTFALVFLSARLRRVPGRDTDTDARAPAPLQLLVRSMPFLLVMASSTANMQTDLIMLGAIRGPSAVGSYRVATAVAQALVLVLSSVSLVVQPRMSHLHEGRNSAALASLVTAVSRLATGLALPVALVYALVGRPLLGLVFGQEYTSAAAPLAVLATARLANAAVGALGPFLAMTDREGILTRALLLEFVGNVTLNALLIPGFGEVGASLATGTSLILMNWFLAIHVFRKTGIDVSILGRHRRTKREHPMP